MPKRATPAAFQAKVVELVARFEKYRDNYRRGGYDESTLRLEYLNPFFRELGWDVDNDIGHPPHLREVRVEYPATDGASSRRADYVFRIGGLDRFVCEAKKYPEKLDNWQYQAQNYAYNLRLWVSLLFNFDEFQLFVVGGKPNKSRPFSPVPGWRLYSWHYADFTNKIWDLLSREAVGSGSLERFVQELPKVGTRGAQQLWLIKPDRNKAVDADFLSALESERVRLARHLVRDNPGIKWDSDGINEAVQRTIDRILFQRVCEDREIDTFQPLKQTVDRWHATGRKKGQLWPSIVANYPNLRAAFNGGLYGRQGQKPHFIERCIIDDAWLEGFIEQLAGEESSYLFNEIPIEILGSVYERFLGSTVDAKGRVLQKPEIRKQGGVFYTPTHIVRYIVDKTIGPLVKEKTPDQLRRIKVVDPACGSGTFLIAALDRLSQACVEYYIAHPKERDPRHVYIDHNNDLRLTSELKKRFAVDCIFGVDIDPQAVEVAEMSLYLKILENETRDSLRRQKQLFPDETFLPDMSNNLKVGNSLVQTDAHKLLSGHDLSAVKPFSWTSEFPELRGRFDAVIGNPPYDVVEKDRGNSSWPHDIFREYLDKTSRLDSAKGGKLNLFRFFLIQALELTKDNGRIGMIVPMAILGDVSCKATRLAFMESTEELQVDAFPQKDNKNNRVFYEAKLSTTILTCPKKAPSRRKVDTKIDLRIFPGNSFMDNPKFCSLKRSDLTVLDPDTMPIPVSNKVAWELAQKLHRSNAVSRLGVIEGLSVTRGEINQTVYRKYITDDPTHSRLLKGVEVGPYRIRSKISQGTVEWFDAGKYSKKHKVPSQVAMKRIALQRITGVDERLRLVGAMAGPNWFFADSTNSIVVSPSCAYEPEYILALFNSKLFQWRFKLTSTNNNVGTNELSALPVRNVLPDDKTDREIYNVIVSSAKAAMRSAEKMEEAVSERGRQSAADQFSEAASVIDSEISKLYGLTDEEIALVESAVSLQADSPVRARAGQLI